MQGSGVNTYKWVNKDGVGVLVKYHWEPLQGIKNLTQPEAEAIQAKNFNHATQDLYQAIEEGNFPQWELRVQIMSDDEHPELDFDPLDDTKLWPEDQFPHLPVGMMTLNRNPDNYFAEVEQVAFGTGVLVDGLDFSDDKMLQGRTFSYSDTQRYRVGANYLQLPINAPKKHVATNQRDGQMTYHVDAAPNQNPHVNYEPSSLNGLTESPRPGADHEPMYQARLVRQKIDRRGDADFKQAGERWRLHTDLEKDDLINNLSDALSNATPEIQDRMVELFSKCDAEYGRRVREGLDRIAHNPSAATSRYMGRNLRPTQNGDPNGHGQRGRDAAVKQAEEMAHEAQPY
jgi:catalase